LKKLALILLILALFITPVYADSDTGEDNQEPAIVNRDSFSLSTILGAIIIGSIGGFTVMRIREKNKQK